MNLRGFLILITAIFSATTNAKTCCFCQIDNNPREHVKYYKLGCEMWLMGRKCDIERVMPLEREDEFEYASIQTSDLEQCRNGKLELGYVGHWSSAFQTVEFLEQVVIPASKNLNISVEIDNTACSGADNPQIVQEALNKAQIPKNKFIQVKANQAISAGMWDKVLPAKTNFFAIMDSRKDHFELPTCKKFEGRSCMHSFQGDETANCLIKKGSTESKELTCCKFDYENINAPRYMQKKSSSKALWYPTNDCNGLKDADLVYDWNKMLFKDRSGKYDVVNEK